MFIAPRIRGVPQRRGDSRKSGKRGVPLVTLIFGFCGITVKVLGKTRIEPLISGIAPASVKVLMADTDRPSPSLVATLLCWARHPLAGERDSAARVARQD